MLVAVEATRFEREVRGIGRYVRAILPRLVAQRPDIRLMLFAKTESGVVSLGELFARDPKLRDHVSVRHVREMARTPADVYWYPWNVVAPVPRHGASVVTVHDVAQIALPDPSIFALWKNLRWRLRFGRSARVATLMLADSAFTGTEIQRMLGVPAERIRVALLAADDFAIPSPAGDQQALEKLGIRTPFILAVGAADKRKNHPMLVRAMQTVVAANPGATLVLAGPRRKANAASADAPWMQTLGFVSESELAALYRNTAALVMPSTYEGFGLPVLEAMRLGAPVICTQASSLPEVGGSAALWVAPDNDAELAEAIMRVLGDESLREALRAASLRQAATFSWDDTARRTLAAFDEAQELYARN